METTQVKYEDVRQFVDELYAARLADLNAVKAIRAEKVEKFNSTLLVRLWKRIFGKYPECEMSIRESFQWIYECERFEYAEDLLRAVNYHELRYGTQDFALPKKYHYNFYTFIEKNQ